MSRAISPGRRAAFDILCELRLRPEAHSDLLLRSQRVTALALLDRNLTTALVMSVLRWGLLLDDEIARRVTPRGRPSQALDTEVMVSLELGLAQLWFFDRIPIHAAIFESVELVKQSGMAHASGLVNAILRRLKSSPRPQPPALPLTSPDGLARAWAHPEWLVSRWVHAFGPSAASAICAYGQAQPPAAIRLASPHAEQALAEEGIAIGRGAFLACARRIVSGDVTKSRALAQGMVRIQDEGSQLIAELAAGGEGAIGSVLDCCAAPGGKTAILAERLPQARIAACDIHPGRMEAMRGLLSKYAEDGRIDFFDVDVARPDERLDRGAGFDRILVDAPCSGTGTLARNPEIRHRLVCEDLPRHKERQSGLIAPALRRLSPGGRLLYSTCSLEPEENEEVVEAALSGERRLRLLPMRDCLLALEGQGILRPGAATSLAPADGRFLRVLPGIFPCDGFFAAAIAREE